MTRPSLARRALLAVLLLIGFYVLALSIAGALAVWPFLLPHFPGKLGAVSVFSALLILWSILPRIDRFPDPGPRITKKDHPRLFAVLEQTAADTGQSMPREVFLVGDMNAFVTQRGGIMGIGSRRVMGLGVPLMQTLTVDEFRAVVAHEFGHF